MASKRKPLDDARRRVKEKLNAIDEQKEFIQNSVQQLTSGVKDAANSLLTECNKTKFFQKYRAVSQELEKCLDDLLLISATISSLEEDGDDEDSAESEDDDKPPDDCSLTLYHKGEDSAKSYSKPKHEETFYKSLESDNTELKSCFSAVSKETDIGYKNEPRDKKTKEFTFSGKCEMIDLIDFEQETLGSCMSGAISPTSYSTKQTEKYESSSIASLSTAECEGIGGHAVETFDLVNFDHSSDTSTTSQFSGDVLSVKKGPVNDSEHSGRHDINQPGLNNSQSSTAYANDPYFPKSLLNTTKETVENSSQQDSLVEENKMVLDLDRTNMFFEVVDLPKCSSPGLQRIGFCEYTSQETVDDVGTTIKNTNTKGTVNDSENTEIKFDQSDKAKMTASYFGKPEAVTKLKASFDTEDSQAVKLNDIKVSTVNDFQSEAHKIDKLTSMETPATNAMHESVITSNEYKCENLGQCKNDMVSFDELTSSQESYSPTHDKGQHKITTSPLSAGDVLEGAFRDKPTNEISEIKGLQIPAFEIPAGNCIEVTVKEVVSPREFWIQNANDDLDLLMEKMCYYFSKRAKSGDKGGLEEAPPVGHVCCGRYTADNVWYRALVIAVSQENCVTVLYVDEGNSETLPLSRLRELDEKFAGLPCQALRVQLKGLKLIEDIMLSEVNEWFKRRVSGETLEAVLCENEADVKPVPLDLYISPHTPRSASDVDYQKNEYSILEMLIREGFAIRASLVESPGTSDDAGPPSSPSDQGIKSESILSSSVTSGFHDTPSATFDDPHSASSPGIHKKGVICRVPPPHIPVDSDGSLYMLVSHIVSPEEFYVHFISSEAGILDSLMTDMNQTYQDLESKDSDIFTPCVGDFCCARFSADGNWYRGLVLQVRCFGESSGKDFTVEVFYIDFGNIEQVTVRDVRELLPQFMSIPAQTVRCSLADVNPSIKQADLDSGVFDAAITAEQDENSKGRLSRRRVRRRRTSRSKEIAVAAGDEDSGGEVLTGDMDVLGLIPEIEKYDCKDRLRSSISDEIAKSYREPSLFSDTAVELFEKILSSVEAVTLKPSWSECATDYFRSLTKKAQKLVGYVVPWDSTMLNNIVNYCQTGECSLPNLGPVLKLNLYDISSEDDFFINAAMVTAEYASSNSIKGSPIVSPVSDEVSNPVAENTTDNEVDTKTPEEEDVPVVRVLHSELLSEETTSDSTLTSPLPLDPSSPSSPTSPTTQLLDTWNPMTRDFKSFRNAYNIETDNLDVAITGYEENRGRICRFYHTKYGCYRGSTCPDKHIEQDVSEKVIIYGSATNPPKLPDIGAWVLVRITAIYNPAHFWVQLPFGIENLSTQRIQSRSGKKTSGEENLKDFNNLMKEMSEFYSKTFRRERSLVPPTEGELVVLRSGQDKKWYRGQVCEEKDEEYKILFVDYGIADWVNRSNICPIMPQFLHLPFQSVECHLANIAPKSEEWTEDSRQHFKSLVEDKILVCQILSVGMNKKMIVNLYESAKSDSQDITEQMIESGYANEAKFKVLKPVDLKSVPSTQSRNEIPG